MADTRKKLQDKGEEDTPNIIIRDFLGMAPNQDPHDLKLGESVNQINCGVGPRGELRGRLGAKIVKFD